ncbi:oligosaccharide flippase family protein [Clostridium estertheticum]|uniref:oligosaccharide flippase family protein n=1 Tax=Clostridium estertheticum TaxID=238834 RepID=UPI001C0B6D9C|nr:oligosaccharide flippase family protein [Clostridium estertheticum]MBU3215569.1 oligosaccharide flippase family protein [Clostridium estertheticum]WAG56813.1 oligosaccharide flippase family protein [Clostridium estertheticum]
MISVKKVIKNAGIYGTVQVLQGAIGFFMLRVYTEYLTPNDYGIFSIVTSITGFLGVFYLLGLNGAISKYYYEYEDDEALFKKFIGTIITTILMISLILTIFLFVTHKFILDKFIKGIDFYPYMAIGLLTVGLSTLFPIYQSILQMQHKAEKYAVQQFSVYLVTLLLNIVFIVVIKLGVTGQLLSPFIVSIITFIYAFIVFTKFTKWKIDKKIIVRSMKYAMPLVPHSLAGWTSTMADRLILNNIKDPSVVGIYNAGYQYGNIINLVATAVNSAFIPWFFGIMKDSKNDKNQIYRFGTAFILLYSLGALWLSILSPYILKFMVHKSFYSAVDCIPYIAFGYVFNGVYYFFVAGLFYNETGTKYIFIASTLSAAVNVALNFLLIPKYEIIGASAATLISFALSSVMVLCLSRRINKKDDLKWNYKKIYSIVIISMIITFIIKKMMLNFISNLCLLLISTIILYFVSGLKFKDIVNLKNK